MRPYYALAVLPFLPDAEANQRSGGDYAMTRCGLQPSVVKPTGNNV